MGNYGMKYSKFKKDIKSELSVLSTLEEKIDYLIDKLDFLNRIKAKTKKDIKLEKEIEHLDHKIYRLRKECNKPEDLGKKTNIVKVIKKIKHPTKRIEEDLNQENIAYLKEQMEKGAPAIAKDPFEYIEALSQYIQDVDIHLNYNNIKYCIEELKEYFNYNNTSIISQKYYIKFLVDRLKKIKLRIPKEEVTNREDLKKVIVYLEEYEYEKLTIANVNIKIIDPIFLEQSLRKAKSLSKLQKNLEMRSEEEFLLVLLDYLEKNLDQLNNDYVGNKHITRIIDFINENILELDSEFYTIFEIKLSNLNKIIKSNKNYVIDKGLLSKVKVSIDDTLSKLEGYRASTMTDNPITTHRMIKYIINDLKDVEFLIVIIKRLPNIVDTKIFDGTLETYFNIILNSNDHSLIIYYQKVIDVLFKYSPLTQQEISLLVNKKINSIRKRESFINREDKDYREALLNQTNIILNKANGYSCNELLEPYMNTGCEAKEVSINNVFTIDGKGTKVKENAFSIRTETRKINGRMDDVYYLTLYTSDISGYFEGKDFKEKLKSLLSSSLVINRAKYSFDEGEVKNAIAFTFKMDPEANIEEIKITKEKIKVAKNFYYNTLNEDFEHLSVPMNDQLIRFYFLGTTIIKKEYEKINKEYDSEYFINPDNFQKVFTQINEFITIQCNKVINEYFLNKGLILIDRQVIANYYKQMKNINISGKQLTNVEELLSEIERMYDSGVIYNASNINYGIDKYSKISSPLREVDSLINQLLAYHYSSCYIDKEEANMIGIILDSICDELNSKHKVKQLTKSKKVVKLYQSDEEDTIV